MAYLGASVENGDNLDDLLAPVKRSPRIVKVCWYCGKGGFLWHLFEGRWRLYNPDTSEIHDCRKPPPRCNGKAKIRAAVRSFRVREPI